MNIYDELEKLKSRGAFQSETCRGVTCDTRDAEPGDGFLPDCAGAWMYIFGVRSGYSG